MNNDDKSGRRIRLALSAVCAVGAVWWLTFGIGHDALVALKRLPHALVALLVALFDLVGPLFVLAVAIAPLLFAGMLVAIVIQLNGRNTQ